MTNEKEVPVVDAMPHIIIPMAGEGKRFKEAGYQVPKPLIQVGGRRLLEWALDAIPKPWRRAVIPVIHTGQAELCDVFVDIEPYFNRMFGTGKPCLLTGPTSGAACSVLAAAVGLPSDAPVIVMNADQWIDIDLEAVHKTAIAEQWDGFVLTFEGSGPQWSYAITDGTDFVVQIVEKKEVSPYPTCGLYWFRRAGDLVKAICSMVYKEDRTNGEFYLAPSMNHLERHRRNVRIVPVKEFHGLGTPEQVREFEALLNAGWKPKHD